MRWRIFWLLWIWASGVPPAIAQDHVVQEFSGGGSTTTGFFKVHDRWEVRWNARLAVSVAVMASDGTIVAGAAGVLRGSLFVPLGGQYYLKISDGTVAPPSGAKAALSTITNTALSTSTNTAQPTSTNTGLSATTNTALSTTKNTAQPTSTNTGLSASTNTAPPADANGAPPAPPEPVVSWHLQIVELGKSVAAGQVLSVYTPFFMVPDSAVAPVAPVASPPNPPPPVLTNEQARTTVVIKGDNAQGAGFLMQSPEGNFVVTHLHLLADNPNVKIFTRDGAPITTLSLKGAVDRDLALFTIKDDHYTYLPLFTNAAVRVEAGDQVIIPDIGRQNDVLLGKPGRVIGMAPDQIDFDIALGPGSSGAPVIDVKSGKVLALVTAENAADVSDFLAKSWPANPAPGSAGIMPYYGLPLDGVRGWEPYDAARFLAETLFLKQFHDDTRCLDSYLNGLRRRWSNPGADNGSGPPDSRYYLNNAKLHEANDTFKQSATGVDRDEQQEAAKELLSDLETVADTGMNTLQNGNFLYAYDQLWARKELAYRQALKKELDDLSNNLVRLETIARTR